MLKCTFNKIAVLSLSALAFVSCKKDDKSGTNGEMMSFTASIGGGAKTEIDGLNNIKWTEKDSIFINGEVFHSEIEGNGETAVFTGPALEGTSYTAYFWVKKDGNTYKLNETQTYNSANNLSGINPMYAESSTTELQFHHICGLLKLDVKGEGKVKEIEVSKDGEALCGPFTIQENRAVTSDNTKSVVTLNCGDGVELDTDDATTFYIALPQGKYDGLTVNLKGGKEWNTTLSVIIHAGMIRTKELTGVDVVEVTPDIPEDCISGKFTINGDGKKVYFSKGNLQATYDGSKYNWGFAASQWGYIGGDNGDNEYPETGNNWIGNEQPNMVVDLFGWSTEATYYGINTSDDEETYFGDFKDWGENFGNDNTWRTLDKDELTYLFNTRTVNGGTEEGKSYQRATINTDAMDVFGVILYPDGYTSEVKTSYTSSEWAAAESTGCVFLPAAGYRDGTSVDEVGSSGRYWNSSYYDDDCAFGLFFNGYMTPMAYTVRKKGFAVRLVQEVK